jgi:hypothetical protein
MLAIPHRQLLASASMPHTGEGVADASISVHSSQSSGVNDAQPTELAEASCTHEQDSQNASRDDDFSVHAAAFRAWAQWLHMPEVAISAWLQGTTRPGHIAAFAALCAVVNVAVFTVTYIIGVLSFDPTWRAVVLSVASVGLANATCVFYMTWRYGPDAMARQPKVMGLLLLLAAPVMFFLDLAPAIGPLARIPFQNRVVFLAGFFVMQYTEHGVGIACIQPWEAVRCARALCRPIAKLKASCLRP